MLVFGRDICFEIIQAAKLCKICRGFHPHLRYWELPIHTVTAFKVVAAIAVGIWWAFVEIMWEI